MHLNTRPAASEFELKVEPAKYRRRSPCRYPMTARVLMLRTATAFLNVSFALKKAGQHQAAALGLSLVAAIARAHGATLRFEDGLANVKGLKAINDGSANRHGVSGIYRIDDRRYRPRSLAESGRKTIAGKY